LLMLGCGSASCEKRQRGRWRSCWWCQVGQGGGALFLIAQMNQNSIDDVLILNASDDFQQPAEPAQASMPILKARFRRCAQAITA